MAAGDQTRAWWPEMLQELESRWHKQLDWTGCIEICREMTALRSTLRNKKGGKPARFVCKCGCEGEIGPAPISVRSLLFALQKTGCISQEELLQLDVNWGRYQKLNKLDGYGIPKQSSRQNVGETTLPP
jgi:hypothetical protein